MTRHLAALLVSVLCLTASAKEATAQPKPRTDAPSPSAKLNEQKIVLVRTTDFERERSGIPTELTIRYPLIEGTGELASKINEALDPRHFGASADQFAFERSIDRELYYTVTYNKRFLLAVAYAVDTVGAYPDTHASRVVVDLRTGQALKAKDVFKPSSLKDLVALADAALQAEKRAALEASKVDPDQHYFVSMEIRSKGHFRPENLDDFSISDEGVTFHYDYGFAHVSKAYEPPGLFRFSFKQLSPFIQPNGPLGQFLEQTVSQAQTGD